MPKAEKGTPKDIANRIKAKGLQKLKWYCQICEKQCRDENGFRNHTQGEGHQRRALQAGSNASRTIQDYSKQFQSDFIRQLRMSHNEKSINANRFYNQYIQNKEHIHMNSTKWHTLTEFVKHLGRSGVVRVREDEKEGLTIQWVDTSSEAIARNEAARRKELNQRGDEETSQKLLQEQIDRAYEQKQKEKQENDGNNDDTGKLDTLDPDVKLDSFIQAPVATKDSTITSQPESKQQKIKKKNVFASMGKSKVTKKPPVEKPMNSFQRIMLQEQEQKQKPGRY